MQNWALAVCAAMVGGALFAMLAPDGSMKRVMSFTLNLFFVCALAAPFLTGLPSLHLPELSAQVTTQNGQLEEKARQQVVQMAEQSLEESLQAVFAQSGYTVQEVIIKIDTESEQTSAVLVLPADSPDSRALEQLTQAQLGVLPQIVMEQEEGAPDAGG